MITDKVVNHSIYRDPSFNNRFFGHTLIKEKVLRLKENPLFNVRQIGQSVGGKEIFCISVGKGSIPVLLWSQMHGDEPTGTMAIFDLFNFFAATDDFDDLRKEILNRCTLHFVPMLNPDGAEAWQRRNIQQIDLNRDLLAMQAPETKALLKLQQELKPEFGFNLHDQDSLWSVSGSKKPAAISLLAPPVDDKGTVTASRLRAIQLVVSAYDLLKNYIPGQIGRWKDEYEPRAVGETFQTLGISTMLIEAGGFAADPEKQYVRELNFRILLNSFSLIADNSYLSIGTDSYNNIPLNNKEIFHLLIRNCRLETLAGFITADIGLNYLEDINGVTNEIIRRYIVADFGDLSTWNAYEITDAGGAILSSLLKPDTPASFNLVKDGHEFFAFKEGILIVNKNS